MPRLWFTLLALALAAVPLAVRAAPFKVYSPHVERGVTELEYRGYYDSDSRNEIDASQQQRFAFGHGFTDYWFSEIYTIFAKEDGGALKNEAWEWENLFQLTPQGKYAVDFGVLTEFEFATRSGEPNEFAIAPIFESEFGTRLVGTLNLFFERQFGSNAGTGTTFAYAARLRYRLHPHFDPALEAYGEPGRINHFGHWNDQEHWLGPALYGKAKVDGGSALEYSAALLFGTSHAASDLRAVLRLEYEF
jgi:hypothetical protein